MEEKCEKLEKTKEKTKLKSRLISFFKDHYKMKLLVLYLIFNLAYITIGSFIFTTKLINPKFDYRMFSLGLRNLLVLNTIIFSIICFEKKYKKNWSHLILEAIFVARCNFNYVCNR